MATQQSIELASRAEAIYEEKLKRQLESSNPDDFVAIEPDSGEFFLGKTLGKAIRASCAAHVDCLPFVFRIGHKTTVELGLIG